jgi:predicted nucleic acid-binding protein
MSKFLADTSLIIDLINNRNGRREFIRQLLKPGYTLSCCTINVIEVYTGMQPGEEAITANWFERLLYRDVTREIAERAGAIRYYWRTRGKTLSLADATIAAVAIHLSLILLTDNGKHFPMPEIVRHPLPTDRTVPP